MHVCVVMCAVPHQVVLCKSLRDTSSRLAELGWLHNKVRKYTDARSLDRAFGLVGQVCHMCSLSSEDTLFLYRTLCKHFPSPSDPSVSSTQSFCASLHQELKEYYRLLSVLHSQVTSA